MNNASAHPVTNTNYSNGAALLAALTRRKGSPAALADWLLERVPDSIPDGGLIATAYAHRSTLAQVWWHQRREDAVWVRMVFQWGYHGRSYDWLFFVELAKPDAGHWLAGNLNMTFTRREPKPRR